MRPSFVSRSRRPARRFGVMGRRQRGLATLVVVMVLLLVMALVAGYTNRNLFFEQRVSANQYRATQALEAAEAGLEWAQAMLNAGRIDDACQPVVDPASAATTFRQRYLDIAVPGGAVTVRDTAAGDPLHPSCVFDGAAWQCSCPVDGAPALAAPAGLGPFPAFRLEFVEPPAAPPGVVELRAVGCTRLDAADVCADAADTGDGRGVARILVALKSALTTPPAAAVTVPGTLDVDAGLLRAVHTDAATGGLTLHAGTIDGAPAELVSVPGTPADLSRRLDAALAALAVQDLMFANLFSMAPQTYRQQPATVVVDCADDCSATLVRDLVRLNPGRMVWVDGDFDLDIADEIGTAAAPALLMVGGSMTISDPAARVTGFVYALDPGWAHTGALTLRGALAADTSLTFTGGGVSTVVYDGTVLDRLRATHGSFVRVPGSWKDFLP